MPSAARRLSSAAVVVYVPSDPPCPTCTAGRILPGSPSHITPFDPRNQGPNAMYNVAGRVGSRLEHQCPAEVQVRGPTAVLGDEGVVVPELDPLPVLDVGAAPGAAPRAGRGLVDDAAAAGAGAGTDGSLPLRLFPRAVAIALHGVQISVVAVFELRRRGALIGRSIRAHLLTGRSGVA